MPIDEAAKHAALGGIQRRWIIGGCCLFANSWSIVTPNASSPGVDASVAIGGPLVREHREYGPPVGLLPMMLWTLMADSFQCISNSSVLAIYIDMMLEDIPQQIIEIITAKH